MGDNPRPGEDPVSKSRVLRSHGDTPPRVWMKRGSLRDGDRRKGIVNDSLRERRNRGATANCAIKSARGLVKRFSRDSKNTRASKRYVKAILMEGQTRNAIIVRPANVINCFALKFASQFDDSGARCMRESGSAQRLITLTITIF